MFIRKEGYYKWPIIKRKVDTIVIMVKLLIGWFRKSKGRIAFIAAVTLFCSVVEVILPYIMARYIDRVITQGMYQSIPLYFFSLFFTFMIEIFFRYKAAMELVKLEVSVVGRAVYRLNNKLLQYPYSYFNNKSAAYLAQRIEQDIRDLVRFVTANAACSVIGICNIFGALLYLGRISFTWVLIFSAIIGGYIVFYRLVQGRLSQLSLATRESDSKYYDFLVNILEHVKSIKVHAIEHIAARGLIKRIIELYRTNVERAGLSFWFSSSREIVNRLFMLVIFTYGGYSVANHIMSVGQFVAVNTYFVLALNGASAFLNMAQDYENVRAGYLRIKAIEEVEAEIAGENILNELLETVILKNVYYSIDGRSLINNFTYKFTKGNIYCITGANGTGKSTLASIIVGLLKPDNGEVFYNDFLLTDLNLKSLRKNKLAFLEQNSYVTEELLKRIQPNNDLLHEFKHNLVELLGKKHLVKEFSGGEKQKIALVTFLKKFDELIILDEPTSAMDKEDSDAFWRYLNRIKQNKIIIVITHKKDEISNADFTISL